MSSTKHCQEVVFASVIVIGFLCSDLSLSYVALKLEPTKSCLLKQ